MVDLPVFQIFSKVFDTQFLDQNFCTRFNWLLLDESDEKYTKEHLHHMQTSCTIEIENAIKSLRPPVLRIKAYFHLKTLLVPVKEELIVMEAVGIAEIQDLEQNSIRVMTNTVVRIVKS